MGAAAIVERTPMSWKAGRDEFVPDVMVYPATEETVRFTGTPVLCVEVLSSNRTTNTVVKSTKYAARGVEHYWIVDLDQASVHLFVREDGTYRLDQSVAAGASASVDFGAGRLTLDLDALLA